MMRAEGPDTSAAGQAEVQQHRAALCCAPTTLCAHPPTAAAAGRPPPHPSLIASLLRGSRSPRRGYVLYLTYKTVLEGGSTADVYKVGGRAGVCAVVFEVPMLAAGQNFTAWIHGSNSSMRAPCMQPTLTTHAMRPPCHATPCHAQAVEFPLKVSQTAAIMEVVHSLVGLVRSPVGITGEMSDMRCSAAWHVR
jgi:hypothetical protein